MIKKGLMALGMVACFGLATMLSVNSSDAQQVLTKEGDPVKCYCSPYGGSTCKASNNSVVLCASGSEANPNVMCRDYDSNC